MEERKTVIDYIGQVFITFGFSIAVLNIFCLVFGEDAKELSSMFSMGKEGLSVATMMQYFAAAVLSVLIRFLFFTDVVIKNMSVVKRTFWMLVLEIAMIVLFIWRFDWFPVDVWPAWLAFFISFGLCFGGGVAVTGLKEKMENKKMEEALARAKGESNEIRN